MGRAGLARRVDPQAQTWHIDRYMGDATGLSGLPCRASPKPDFISAKKTEQVHKQNNRLQFIVHTCKFTEISAYGS
jgi:hypothetical protein